MLHTESSYKQRNRLLIYDFDGTLFESPDRKKGSILYHKATGNYWPYRGWWGRIESLITPVIPDPIPESLWVKEVVGRYREDIKDKNAFVVLMTGRPYKIRHRVKEILNSQNIIFHREYYRGMPGQKGRDTLDIKINIMEKKLFHDNLKSVEIFEDRTEHLNAFMTKAKLWKSLMANNLEKIVVHDATNNLHYEF